MRLPRRPRTATAMANQNPRPKKPKSQPAGQRHQHRRSAHRLTTGPGSRGTGGSRRHAHQQPEDEQHAPAEHDRERLPEAGAEHLADAVAEVSKPRWTRLQAGLVLAAEPVQEQADRGGDARQHQQQRRRTLRDGAARPAPSSTSASCSVLGGTHGAVRSGADSVRSTCADGGAAVWRGRSLSVICTPRRSAGAGRSPPRAEPRTAAPVAGVPRAHCPACPRRSWTARRPRRRSATELTERVTALAAAGHRPGLGTLLVGDDPGSRWYVNAKHSDCAQVGIASIQRELPATATRAGRARRRRGAQRRPRVHRLHRPAAAAAGRSTESAVLEAMDPAKDADGLHPVNLGRLVLNVRGPLPCTPVGIVELLRRYDVPIAGAEVVVDRPRHHRRPAARAAAHPALGERDGDPVPHRHPRPGGARAQRRHRGRRGRRPRAGHGRDGQAGRRRPRRRRQPGRRQDRRRRRPRRRATWPATWRRTLAGSAP